MKPTISYPTPSTSTVILIILPLIFFILITLTVYPNESKLQTINCTKSSDPHVDFLEHIRVKPDIRLFVGVLTLPGNYERRNLVRLAYAIQPNHTGHVDVKFVFCNVTKEEDILLVAMEIIRYDDIMILDCAENMDNGKTYTYFSTLPKIFDGEKPYDYVMKTDDDTYLRLNNLVDTLKRMPRDSLYFGLMNPCFGTKADHYMSGLGYVISWDLVEWISTSDVARTHQTGPEDLITGKWFRESGKEVHMYDATPAMYDYFEPPHLCYRHEFIPDTVAVHKLKNNLRWARTLQYFNVTDSLKPSKLYRLP